MFSTTSLPLLDGPPELLLTADSGGESFNACAWDPRSGTQLRTFKGSSSSPKTLALVADSFLISACPDKPVLNVWKVSKREQVRKKYGIVLRKCQVTSAPTYFR